MTTTKDILSWNRSDIERRLFFPGSNQTHVNSVLGMLIGMTWTGIFFAILIVLPPNPFASSWLELGIIPYAIAFVFFWSLAILFVKWRKLALQKQALEVHILPDEAGFVLTPRSADQIIENLYARVRDPERFILFNRVLCALSNLKNLGRVSDVDVIIRSQSDLDLSILDSSYSTLKGFIWAMPVLGFIGTVLGLSVAIGGFGDVLAAGGEMSELRNSLKGVVGGLSIAFETTFQGLVCTLIVKMLLTFLKKKEESFQEDCGYYCHKHIVSKLRTLVGEASA